MNNDNQPKTKKRKRSTNTTREQYEMYVNEMENDYYFRSNTINPTIGENYINEKWKQLTDKLNSVGDGPHLAIDEWKKRFTDWKYTTRSKYRKIADHRRKTGSSPHSGMTMTDIEERALGVWGIVVLTGSKNVTNYDGLEYDTVPSTNNVIYEIDELQNYTELDSINSTVFISETAPSIQFSQILEPVQTATPPQSATPLQTTTPVHITTACQTAAPSQTAMPSQNTAASSQNTTAPSHPPTTSSQNTTPLRTTARKRIRVKPLSVLTEKLLENNVEHNQNNAALNTILSSFTRNYIEMEKKN